MPTPTPTPEEIELVDDAIMTETLDKTTSLVDGLTDVQWVATLADLEVYVPLRFKMSRLTGQIAGYQADTNEKRLAIRNAIRRRFDLPDLLDEKGNTADCYLNLTTTGAWFNTCR